MRSPRVHRRHGYAVAPARRGARLALLIFACVCLAGAVESTQAPVAARAPAEAQTAAPAKAPAAAAQSPYPIYTPETFVSTMKTVGQNFGGVTEAIAQGDFESAKSRAIRAREQLATTITFWRKNTRNDAVAMLRAATAKLDALDTVLSKTPVDRDAASEAARQVDSACQACHSTYREQDPSTRAYRIKLQP